MFLITFGLKLGDRRGARLDLLRRGAAAPRRAGPRLLVLATWGSGAARRSSCSRNHVVYFLQPIMRTIVTVLLAASVASVVR